MFSKVSPYSAVLGNTHCVCEKCEIFVIVLVQDRLHRLYTSFYLAVRLCKSWRYGHVLKPATIANRIVARYLRIVGPYVRYTIATARFLQFDCTVVDGIRFLSLVRCALVGTTCNFVVSDIIVENCLYVSRYAMPPHRRCCILACIGDSNCNLYS